MVGETFTILNYEIAKISLNFHHGWNFIFTILNYEIAKIALNFHHGWRKFYNF